MDWLELALEACKVMKLSCKVMKLRKIECSIVEIGQQRSIKIIVKALCEIF